MKKILYTKFFNEKIEERVDVILSPEFYWIKKIDIPLKSLKDAKKIAKSLFDLKGDYLYEAFEIDGKFFAVAINKDLKINIPLKYINSIRLAQTELYPYDCIKIDETHYIQKIDDMLFCFPTPSQNCKDLKDVLNTIKLSKIKFNILNRVEIDKSILALFISIFLIINVSLIINIISIKKETKKIEQNILTYLSKNNLPHTKIQLNSILNSLLAKYKKQKEIKRKLEIISNVPLKKGEFFKTLLFDGKSFFIEIASGRNFDKFFKKYFKIQSSKEKEVYKARLF